MKKNLYREESLASISTPEQMDKYIKVTSPKVWIFIAALAAIIIAFFLLSSSYVFETATKTTTLVDSGTGYVFLDSSNTNDLRALNTNSKVILNGKYYNVDDFVIMSKDEIISELPFTWDFYEQFIELDRNQNFDTDGEDSSDEKFFLITYDVGNEVGDGVYDAKLVLEQANVFDFLFTDKK